MWRPVSGNSRAWLVRPFLILSLGFCLAWLALCLLLLPILAYGKSWQRKESRE